MTLVRTVGNLISGTEHIPVYTYSALLQYCGRTVGARTGKVGYSKSLVTDRTRALLDCSL